MTPRKQAAPAAPEVREVKRRAKRGTVSATLRPDGLWQASIELPPEKGSGKRRRKYVTAKTQRAAISRAVALRAKLDVRGNMRSSTPTVNQWLDLWLADIAPVRPNTKTMYRNRVKYIRDTIGKVKLEALEPSHVREVTDYIIKEKGLSSTTANNTQGIFGAALRDAMQEGIIDRNVAKMIRAPARNIPKVGALSVDEARAVIAEAARPGPENRLGSRYAAALLMGARQSELLGLEWSRVDFEKNQIDLSWQLQRLTFIHGCEELPGEKWSCGYKRAGFCPKRHHDLPVDWEHRHLTGGLYLARPKTKAGTRTVPLFEPLRSILVRQKQNTRDEPNLFGLVWTADPKKLIGGDKRSITRATDEGTLDGMPIDHALDNEMWHDLLERAGVHQVRLHDARRTTVTLLIHLGVQLEFIKGIVGHSTVMSTERYVGDTTALDMAAMQALGDLLQGEHGTAIRKVGDSADSPTD